MPFVFVGLFILVIIALTKTKKNMNYYVKHQEKYSRGELLVRALFGLFYIGIPHFFVLYFLSIGALFVRLIAFWTILFTGKYPKGMWDYQVKLIRYQLRVSARLSNFSDGYPAFGLNGTDENTNFDIEYKENVSFGTLIVRTLFGPVMLIPHIFVLPFRMIATVFAQMFAFYIILFTGKYPKGMFDFAVGLGRWQTRINCYLNFYTDNYPAFTGKVLPGENEGTVEAKTEDMEVLDA
jgi:hypothetical protein